MTNSQMGPLFFGVVMKKVIKDRISPRQKVNGTYPWDFAAPTKDVSHSGCLSAGNDYGVGFRQPVGKFKAEGPASGPIPQSPVSFSPKEIFYGEDKKG